MIGPRVGVKVGQRAGIAAGVMNDEIAAGGATWTVDATSGKAMPATNAEWVAFIAANGLAISPPTSIYTCQDAAGALADANTTFPLAVSGTGQSYLQAVAGWSAKAVTLTEGTTGGWRSTDAGLPNPAAASCAMLAYVVQPAAAPAATRNLAILTGVASAVSARINAATGFSSLLDVGNVATGATNVTGQVLPWMVVYNFTASSCVGYTLAEKLTPAFSAGVGRAFMLGSTGAAAAARYLYAVRWDGAAAEISAANAKLLQQALVWSPTWV